MSGELIALFDFLPSMYLCTSVTLSDTNMSIAAHPWSVQHEKHWKCKGKENSKVVWKNIFPQRKLSPRWQIWETLPLWSGSDPSKNFYRRQSYACIRITRGKLCLSHSLVKLENISPRRSFYICSYTGIRTFLDCKCTEHCTIHNLKNIYIKKEEDKKIGIASLANNRLCSFTPQSWQSTRLFLQPSELEPRPLAHWRVCPLLVPGGAGTHLLTREGVGGGSQFGRGDRHWGILGIYVLYFDHLLLWHCKKTNGWSENLGASTGNYKEIVAKGTDMNNLAWTVTRN